MIYYLIFTSVLINLINANSTVPKCDPKSCPKIPKHYEELGCKAIQGGADCCPIRFECPNFDNYGNDTCHYKGKVYQIDEHLPEHEITNCVRECKCTDNGGFSNSASFKCGYIDCIDLSVEGDENPENCLVQYELGSCCPINKICDKKEIEKLPLCYYEGKQFRDGELIIPRTEPCYECLCDGKFKNTTDIYKNPNCHKIQCGVELHNLHNIKGTCAPIYYGEDRCCPVEWRCAKEDDTLSNVARSGVKNPEMSCEYGELTLTKGENVTVKENCLQCSCSVPPIVHCVKEPNCKNNNM